jgi:outer membrane protein assembly factor BamD (BamD/ComL family)
MVAACAPFKQMFVEREECGHLKRVDSFISRGDFESAMKESQDILARSPKTPPGDEALMNMGLISAHYANPKRDYKKALGYFMRVEKDFPRSPLVEEAKIWVSVLHAFEKAKQVDIEIEEKKKELGK